jgi:hypothetical protein
MWVLYFIYDVRLGFAVHSGQLYESSIQQALIKAPATCSEQRVALHSCNTSKCPHSESTDNIDHSLKKWN